jgi:hypothetical protein
MKRISLAALAAAALVCLPLMLHAETASAPAIGNAINAAVDPGHTHDWQLALAAVLGIVAWALRRFVEPTHIFHTQAGAIGITAACTAIGALVPVLQAHAFTIAALMSAIASGVTAAVALSNPSVRADDATPPTAPTPPSQVPAALALIIGLGFAFGSAGCAAFAAQPVALQKAEASALQCGLQAVQSGMKQLSPAVLDALAGDSPDWRAQLGKLESTGTNALLCAVAHSLYDALGAEVSAVAQADVERLAVRRLALADAGDAPPLPTPTRRVLARGLSYLRERGVTPSGPR